MMELEYFGTDLNSAGHMFWELYGRTFGRSRTQFNDLPFNPEGLPYKAKKDGDCQFYQFAGFSIMAIEGSCYDRRPGSKSIFFVRATIEKEQMKKLILDTPVAVQMIEKMPFQINW